MTEKTKEKSNWRILPVFGPELILKNCACYYTIPDLDWKALSCWFCFFLRVAGWRRTDDLSVATCLQGFLPLQPPTLALLSRTSVIWLCPQPSKVTDELMELNGFWV